MTVLFILLLVSLVLVLFLWAARRVNRSETAEMINQAICISAGAPRRK